MQIRTLELQNFRSYASAAIELSDGLTAIVGENGQGKTNLLEAISWIAGMGSFRGVPDDALIRMGEDAAIVRSTVVSPEGREQLIEVELPRIGRNRIQVNRQRISRARDLLGVVQVTVFSPDDLRGQNRTFFKLPEILQFARSRLFVIRTSLDRTIAAGNPSLIILKWIFHAIGNDRSRQMRDFFNGFRGRRWHWGQRWTSFWNRG